MKLPGIKGSALFGYLSDTGTRTTGFPFYAVSTRVKRVAIPSRQLGGLTRLIRPKHVMATAYSVISVTKLIGNTDGNRNLNGRFLNGVHRASTVVRILHYFSGSGVIRISNSMSPIHSGRVVSARLRLGSLRAVRGHVGHIRGVTGMKNSGRTGVRCSMLVRCGSTLRRKGSTHAISFRDRRRVRTTGGLFLLATGPILCIYGISSASTTGNGRCIGTIHRTIGSRGTRLLVVSTRARTSVTRLRDCRRGRVFLRSVKLGRSNYSHLVGTVCDLLALRAFVATNRVRIGT